LLGLGKELCMRRVSRVNEGVETSAVSTSRHGITIVGGCGLGNLGLSSGDLGSLNWNSLRLSSLRLNSLRLNPLRLSNGTARELSGICVVLEVKMCWVSRVHKRIEVSSLLSRLSWLNRGKLSLDRGWLALNRCWLSLNRGWLALNRGWLALNRCWLALNRRWLALNRCWLALNRCWLSLNRHWSALLLPHRSWLCTRCLTSRSRLCNLSCCRIRIKCSRIQSVSSFRDMISFKDSKPILASSVSDRDGLPIVINVTVLPNSLSIRGGLLPEHRAILLGKS